MWEVQVREWKRGRVPLRRRTLAFHGLVHVRPHKKVLGSCNRNGGQVDGNAETGVAKQTVTRSQHKHKHQQT